MAEKEARSMRLNADTLTGSPGTYFWSNGHGFGTFTIERAGDDTHVTFEVIEGQIPIKGIKIKGYGNLELEDPAQPQAGETIEVIIEPT